MRQLGLRGKGASKRRPRTTQSDPSHRFEPNVLGRQFSTAQPDAVWLADITYILTVVVNIRPTLTATYYMLTLSPSA